MSLKLYYDLMSQPSRALYILLKKVNCNFESKLVDLRAGAHFTEEFAKINRHQKVPVIEHNGFVLTERVLMGLPRFCSASGMFADARTDDFYAIMRKRAASLLCRVWASSNSILNTITASVAIIRYLASEGKIPASLCPRDRKLGARVDEFLEWQHLGLRAPCAMYFRVVFFNSDTSKIPVYERRMTQALEEFSTKWLGRGHRFVVGDEITVADLLAACELEQPRMTGFDPMEKYPVIGEWKKLVQDYFNPHYDEAHVILNKITKSAERRKTSSML